MSLVVADVRQAIADAITAGITDIQVNPYMLSAPVPPAIDIYPDETEYDLAMGRGLDKWRFIVRAVVGHTADLGSQANLDLMLAPAGARSIKQLVEVDRTLGGLVEDSVVLSCTGYRVYLPHSVSPLLGCEWTVELYAVGT